MVNKELNVTLEDALFSTKSMAIMFGNGTATEYATSSTDYGAGASGTTNSKYIMKTEQFTSTTLTTSGVLPTQWSEEGTEPELNGGWDALYTAPDGKRYVKRNPKFYDENGTLLTGSTWAADKVYFCSFDLAISGAVISINKDSFPGNYWTIVTIVSLAGNIIDLN